MINITFLYFFLIIICFANGSLFLNTLNKNNNYGFFERIIFGIVLSGFIGVFLNFFLPLNDIIIILNFIFSLIYIYHIKLTLKYSKSEISIFIILSLLSFLQIYAAGFSDDLNHYHGGHITNSDNGNIIIGSNLLNDHFGYSPIWLITQSYLNLNAMFLQSIHVVNAILFTAVVGILLNEIYKNYKDKLANPVNFFCIFSSLFILLKYTRLKEFGVDRPATLLFIFLIFYFVKNLSTEKNKEEEIENLILFKFFLVGIYLFFNKIILLSIFILPTFYLISKKNYKFFFNKYFIFLLLIFFTLIIRNILVSGCIIYPMPFLCIDLSWTTEDYAQRLYLMTEIITKNINNTFNKEEYLFALESFRWVNGWYARTKIEFNEFIFTCAFAFLLTTLVIKKTKKIKFFCKKILLYSIFLITIFSILIFIKAPVIRYQHQLFLCFFYLISLFFFTNVKIKNYIIYIIIFVLLFNVSKNIKRISNMNFVNNPTELIKKIKWYRKPVLVKKEGINLYNGWIDAYPVGKNNLDRVKYKEFGIFKILYR